MFSLNLPDTCGGVESLQSSILVLQLGAAWKPGPTACVARFSAVGFASSCRLFTLGIRYPICYAFPYFQLNSGWLDAIFCHVNDPRMETKEKDGLSAWLQASDRCRDLYIVYLLGNLTPQPKLDSLCRTRLCRFRNGMQRIKVKRQKLMPAIKAVRDPFLFPVALRSLPESTGTCLFKCIGQLLCGLLPHFLNLAALNPAHPQRMARTSPMAYWIPFRFSDLKAFCYPLSVALPLESIHNYLHRCRRCVVLAKLCQVTSCTRSCTFSWTLGSSCASAASLSAAKGFAPGGPLFSPGFRISPMCSPAA